jgi:hypothetical protein
MNSSSHDDNAAAAAPPPAPKLPPNCQIEPIEDIRTSFIDKFQKVRIAQGEKPAERAVFRKQHGVAKGKLSAVDTCPAKFRAGLWAGGPYDVWMRWSSDVPPSKPDQDNNTIGFALKLFGVTGPTLATDNPLATNADLIFQNSDIFFVDNAREMCAISSDDSDAFLAVHMRSNLVLKEMAKLEKSLVSVRYSSCLPYALGNNIVKYRLIAAEPVQDVEPGASHNYLAEDIKRRLQAGAISFLLEAQSFVDDSVTPIDRATERWEEKISPFVTVARLDIPAQDIGAAGQAAYGEGLAFSPWRTLHENRPLGSIADARRISYPASAAVRRSLNGQSMQEPDRPR